MNACLSRVVKTARLHGPEPVQVLSDTCERMPRGLNGRTSELSWEHKLDLAGLAATFRHPEAVETPGTGDGGKGAVPASPWCEGE